MKVFSKKKQKEKNVLTHTNKSNHIKREKDERLSNQKYSTYRK